ncbi:MAG: betaine/proline/choline family ABC transporter ATP-binding protein [Candidatus Bipolaricaulota bacterium]|nr:betaine/proline/choline family ABC transporter ATP-binding protein [Candidatus Bipolaricaulota bacterium]MBS3791024.1 betaine/proline/choline family ABC transporter ATP-binding protein [Candidatus Bipolaricaulota bacterium]
MIKLENVKKVYPDGTEAVKGITFEINEGELCVLLGPSGCGKTTTMKMINRLIPITEGHIYIDGTDNREMDENELRREMGYAIQEIGLFPHMTVRENIATVPTLKNWSDDEKEERARNLLNLMGMDPDEFIDKYPTELSGGQRQRVGVARSLGADPPIMLMDEPFGAIDPITRDRLQDEFLKIQNEIQKTIVFVTHDINEAIKMGDKVALLKEGELIQYSQPAELLAAPKNRFVRDFVGSDRTLKSLRLMKVDEAMKESPRVVKEDQDLESVGQIMREEGVNYLIVVENGNKLKGWINREDVEEAGQGRVADAMVRDTEAAETGTSLANALTVMLERDVANLPVVDGDNNLKGLLTFNDLQSLIGETYTESGGKHPEVSK